MANVELNPRPPMKTPDQTPKPRTSAADAASIPNGGPLGGQGATKGAEQQGALV